MQYQRVTHAIHAHLFERLLVDVEQYISANVIYGEGMGMRPAFVIRQPSRHLSVSPRLDIIQVRAPSEVRFGQNSQSSDITRAVDGHGRVGGAGCDAAGR